MKILHYPIKNYQFTLIIVLMIILIGSNSLMTMPRAEDPTMKAPKFPVVVVYPGTSPKDMEQLVVNPLESRFYGLDKMKQIKSYTNNGSAFLFLEFEHDADYDTKFQEVVRELNATIQEENLDNLYRAEVLEIDPTGVNVLQASLISETASDLTMKRLAEQLKTKLEKVKALKNVSVEGISDPIIRVDLQLGKMAQLKIPIQQVAKAIQSEATTIPGGSIHVGEKSLSVNTGGGYTSVKQVKSTIVATYKGKNITLEDIAEVYSTFTRENYITRLNGYRCLFITAAQKAGKNISETQENYLKIISSFKSQLPDNVDLILNFDQADNVNKRLSYLGKDFMIAIFLVLLTLLPLGLRASLVVMIAIPLSLSIGIVVLNAFGYSLNQLSIVGFVVALGLVVDDSIVVVENIERWMREGYSRTEAAVKGTNQIAVAVIGCTATLVIAFMPLLFMPDVAGDFIRSLPTAVIGSIVASMFVATLVVPFLASRILKPHKDKNGNKVLQVLQHFIHLTFGKWLDKALKRPVLTLFLAALIFAGSLAMLPVLGFSLFPPSEKPQFMVTLEMPSQSGIYYADSITEIIEKDLASMDKVRFYSSNVGRGNPRIYYNVNRAPQQEDYAEIFVQLDRDVSSTEKIQLINQFREMWDDFVEADVQVQNFQQGVPIISPVEVRIFGENLDTLRHIAKRVEGMMKNTEGAVYVNNPVKHESSQLKININREKASAFGVPTASITQTIRMAIAGIDVASYTNQENNNDYSIRITVPRKDYPKLSLLDEIYVNNVNGQAIPLRQLATVELEKSPVTINHINRSRVVYVNSFVANGLSNSEVINKVWDKMKKMDLPNGYNFKMGGEVESREQSFGGFGTTLLIAAFLFIAVLVLEFKTLKSTIIVLSVIPLGIVGAVVALWLTGNTLSFVATVGLVALAGIEVKNTILLVDLTNQMREEGVELVKATEEAAEIRFLPILLTTLTAIGGLLPIAWSENPLISPLAIVIIGGLISSTFLSRIVTPVVYKLIPPKVEKK